MTVIAPHLTSCLAVLSVLLLKKTCVQLHTSQLCTGRPRWNTGTVSHYFLMYVFQEHQWCPSSLHASAWEGEGESTPFDLSCDDCHEKTNPLKEAKLYSEWTYIVLLWFGYNWIEVRWKLSPDSVKGSHSLRPAALRGSGLIMNGSLSLGNDSYSLTIPSMRCDKSVFQRCEA